MSVFTPTRTSADLAVVALLLPSCGLLQDAPLPSSGNAQFLPPPPPPPPPPSQPLPPPLHRRRAASRTAGDGAGNSRAELLRRAVVVDVAA